MTAHYTTIFIAGLMLCSSTTIVAQQPSKTKQNTGTGIDPTVEIVTDYEGKLLGADKIDITYNANDSTIHPKIKFTYPFNTQGMQSRFSLEPISAISLATDNLLLSDTGYGYFRAGFMYPVAPEADLYLHSQLSRESAVSIYLKHRSFWGKSPLYDQAPVTPLPIANEILSEHETTQAGVALQHIYKQVAISVKSEYKHRSLLYYGQDTLLLREDPGHAESSFVRNFMRQTFNIFKNDARIYTRNNSDKTFSFDLGAQFDYIRESAHRYGNRPIRQYTVGMDGFLNLKMNAYHAFNVQLFSQAYNRDNLTRQLSSGLFNAAPSYVFQNSVVKAAAGVKAEGIYDGHGLNYNFYPSLFFHYITYNGLAIPYLEVSGGTTLNPYDKITAENPYVLPGLDVSNTRTRIEGEAGVKGKFSTIFAYCLKVSYAMIDSMYFFVNSTEPINEGAGNTGASILSNFDVEYDNISRITTSLELSAKYKNFDAMFFFNYNHYKLDTLENAWHKPNIEVGLQACYKWGSFIFTLNTFFRGKTPVLLPAFYGADTAIKAYMNLGLTAEYRITEKISVFLQGNNLLHQHYQDYYLYYHPGVTVGGGLTVSF
ncbi:MAG: TonB-dependent receptor [Tannerellaceae bacterium]|jgi:hypothetical protein|nr:TonB-dependent receptor [Tannerellaceae bacterium]